MKMTAAVMYEQGLPAPYQDSQPLRIEEVELDGPREDEVLVEVKAAGLCHSDLSQVAGLRKRTLPVVMGHEGAGVVRDVGPGVTDFSVGDHVLMTVGSGCGQCPSCVNSRPVLCDEVAAARGSGTIMSGRSALSKNDVSLYHHSGISSFAQYSVVAPGSLIRVDPEIPFEVVAMFGCAVVTGAGAVFNAAKVRPGQSVAVVGLGGVGLNAVMAARIAGASRVIGVDIQPSKFELARDLGCTHTFDAAESGFADAVQQVTNGGVEVAFEITGSEAGMHTATALTRKGGEVTCVGLGASEERFEYAHTALVAQEKVFRGSLMGSCVPRRDLPIYLDFYKEGRLPVDRLISGTMSFDQLNNNLDRLQEGAVLRQILLPNG